MNPQFLAQLSALSPQAQKKRMTLLKLIENTRGMLDALEKDMNSAENLTEYAFTGREWQDMVALTIRITLTELALLTQTAIEPENAKLRNPPNPPGSEPQG